jgi:hypothetical protein
MEEIDPSSPSPDREGEGREGCGLIY